LNYSYLIFFLDINMPVMDGYKTVEQLKLLMQSGDIEEGVCIANTAYIDLKTKVRCYEVGMDYYFTKPLKFRDIQACFEKIVPR
jgi:CheY-like chemotaxis protein